MRGKGLRVYRFGSGFRDFRVWGAVLSAAV